MGKVTTDSAAQAAEKAFDFPAGLFGFPTVKKYIVAEIPGGGDIFKQMIALDDPSIAFTIVYPYAFFPDYAPDIPEEELRELEADSSDQIMLYTIANVPADFRQATANLRAPLLFNPFSRKGRQVILPDDRHQTRERLFKA